MPKGAPPMRAYRNRPEDVAWAKENVRWLFALAGVACPPIRVNIDKV